MRWPPIKKEASGGESSETVAAIGKNPFLNSLESWHAWYTQPWLRARNAQARSSSPGPTLSDFEVQYEIGEGLTSKVYLARIKGAKQMAPEKNDNVVLKVMRKESVLSDKLVVKDLAEDEIRMLMSAQKSQHVIRLMGTFESATHIYMVMEWAPCDFFQLMTDHFGSERYWYNVKIYAGQVLIALEDLHRAGLIYCDLKPENLLVSLDGSIKVSDLGLATRFSKNGNNFSRVCGTAEYMSPEMILQSSLKGYNHMTDIWSFGILIYEMLTCTTPFKQMAGSSSEKDIFYQIRNHKTVDIQIKHKVTTKAKNIVLGLLTRDPNQRLGSKDTPGKYASIREHPWFAPLNWIALEKGVVSPSIFPRASTSMYKPVSDDLS